MVISQLNAGLSDFQSKPCPPKPDALSQDSWQEERKTIVGLLADMKVG